MNVLEQARYVLLQQADALTRCAERLAARPEAYTNAVTILHDTLQGGATTSLPTGIATERTLAYRRPAKIVVTGVGKSGHIARKVCATLQSTGSLAVFLHPTEALHGDLGVISPGDTLLVFSHSGRTEELIRLVAVLRQQQRPCRVVAVCGDAHSPLSQLSDAWIDARVDAESDKTLPAPTASTTLALALGDCIAMTLARMQNITANDFAANHPGGNLGQILNAPQPVLPTANEFLSPTSHCIPSNKPTSMAIPKSLRCARSMMIPRRNFLLNTIDTPLDEVLDTIAMLNEVSTISGTDPPSIIAIYHHSKDHSIINTKLTLSSLSLNSRGMDKDGRSSNSASLSSDDDSQISEPLSSISSNCSDIDDEIYNNVFNGALPIALVSIVSFLEWINSNTIDSLRRKTLSSLTFAHLYDTSCSILISPGLIRDTDLVDETSICKGEDEDDSHRQSIDQLVVDSTGRWIGCLLTSL
ncbi:hypothetical protein BDF19DRAFT_432798 [Syncephalis fuscata]|nr:hypothetical protein BDF19DRAFT_432798 [Syncephalis fuscata]